MSKFTHQCPDWDYMEIDETMPEITCCLCDFGPELQVFREEQEILNDQRELLDFQDLIDLEEEFDLLEIIDDD